MQARHMWEDEWWQSISKMLPPTAGADAHVRNINAHATIHTSVTPAELPNLATLVVLLWTYVARLAYTLTTKIRVYLPILVASTMRSAYSPGI